MKLFKNAETRPNTLAVTAYTDDDYLKEQIKVEDTKLYFQSILEIALIDRSFHKFPYSEGFSDELKDELENVFMDSIYWSYITKLQWSSFYTNKEITEFDLLYIDENCVINQVYLDLDISGLKHNQRRNNEITLIKKGK